MKKSMLRNLGPKAFSHLTTYDTCHLQYQFQHLDKVKHDKPEPLKFGIGFHEARARYYSECRESKVDTDYDAMDAIAKSAFHDTDLPLDRWDEFRQLCRSFAENRPFSPSMGIEVRFGVNRDMSWSTFDDCDGFRGVLDGLEIKEDIGTITDAKTARSMDLPFTQLETYAAFMSLRYPHVERWRLVYDFVRYNKIREHEVLAENMTAYRDLIMSRVQAIEHQKDYKPQPSEACLECPFVAICDYKIKGLTKPKTPLDVESMMEDYFFAKAKAAQLKKIVKQYVENHGDVRGDRLAAGFFPKETRSCDKVNLIKLIKQFKRNPVEYVEFPAAVLKKIQYDKQMGDDAANVIFIDQEFGFDIRKREQPEEVETP